LPKEIHTEIYDLDYYSGSQMFLYVGDVWVDEITSLQYQTSQQKMPLYGYASQLFDDTTTGQVLVQGNFSINYKEQGYLWAVLRRYKHMIESRTGIATLDKKKQDKRDDALLSNWQDNKGGWQDRPKYGSGGKLISRAGIERLVQGEATTGERYKFYTDFAGYSTFNVKSPKDKMFENIVEIFEDQIWDKSINNQGLNSQVRRTDDNKFDNFDMYVVFGNYANAAANHTVQKIIGVRLTSQGKRIIINGEPIQEEYSFIARSVA